MPYLRWLVTAVTVEAELRFDLRLAHVRFVVCKVALGQVFLKYFHFPLSVSYQCPVLI